MRDDLAWADTHLWLSHNLLHGQKPAARLLRVALLMLLFKLMFGDDDPRPDQVVATYRTTWKVLFCAALFFAADMFKVILVKTVAGHFHNQLHFSKMQDALNKVTAACSHLGLLTSACWPHFESKFVVIVPGDPQRSGSVIRH